MHRVALLVCGLFILAAPTWAVEPAQSAKAHASPKSTVTAVRYLPDQFAGRAGAYYRALWGIDSPSVKWAESGEIVRCGRVRRPKRANRIG